MDLGADDSEIGWQVIGLDAGAAPFVYACPHGGRHYPPALLGHSALRADQIRLSEDAFTDRLFQGASEHAPMIRAGIARAFIDFNRDARELDANMFETRPAGEILHTARVAAGFGVVPRLVREGLAIYRGKLPAAEAARRIARYHRPYHAQLASMLAAARARFGYAVQVDCHSMPSGRSDLADIVLGDRYGAAAAPGLTALFEHGFAAAGFAVTRNHPYAGGYATATYGQPQAGLHAIQIEVNRALYLDETRIAPNRRFDEIRARIETALATIRSADIAALCRPPLAAE